MKLTPSSNKSLNPTLSTNKPKHLLPWSMYNFSLNSSKFVKEHQLVILCLFTLIIVCLLFYFWPCLFVFLHRFTFFLKRLVSIKFKQWWSMFNFTNINKSNNHISPQTIEHKTYLDISLWVQTQRYGGVKPVNGISLWKLYLKPQYKYKQINLKKNLHRFSSNQKTCTDSLPIKKPAQIRFQ